MATKLANLIVKCIPGGSKLVKICGTALGQTDCYFVGAIDSAIRPTLTPTPTPIPSQGLPIVIDSTTKIYIWFDDSGSMNSTLSPLVTMRNTILKNCLLQFFNNDSDLYDQNVLVQNFSSKTNGYERTFNILNTVDQSASKVINLVFQDESSPYGNFTTNLQSPTPDYNTDIANLRNTLTTAVDSSYYRGIVFQVATGAYGEFVEFKNMLQDIENGTGLYTGTSGLSDRNEIGFEYDVVAGSTPQYYVDKIISGLNTLGYNLQPC